MPVNPTRKFLSPIALGFVLVVAGCNYAEFGSETKKAAAPEGLMLTCHKTRGNDKAVHVVNGDDGTRLSVQGGKDANVSISGNFCPEAPLALDIVFAVDFSLSMYNAPEKRGNDPVKGDTCGRLEAFKAILKSHRQSLASQDAQIRVGVIQFSSDLVGQLPLMDIQSADQVATVENFCRGITGTNYKVAIDAATQMLKNESARKVVYLISDGLPTEGGKAPRGFDPSHRQASLNAVKNLRNQVTDVTINTVFLGDLNVQKEEAGFDAIEFLTTFTGEAERVKQVAVASQLAEEILNLKPPFVDLDLTSVRATIQPDDGVDPQAKAGALHPKAQAVPILSFKPDPTNDQVFAVRTDAFSAFPNGVSPSLFVLRVVDKQGAVYELRRQLAPATSTGP